MLTVIINIENDMELKRLGDYNGPIPAIGQTIVFLSGEGVFDVIDTKWITSKDEWYIFTCEIHVRPRT